MVMMLNKVRNSAKPVSYRLGRFLQCESLGSSISRSLARQSTYFPNKVNFSLDESVFTVRLANSLPAEEILVFCNVQLRLSL